MGGSCITHGGDENAYNILVGKTEGNTPLVRARRRWGIILKLILAK
jgi:hypothetical protein